MNPENILRALNQFTDRERIEFLPHATGSMAVSDYAPIHKYAPAVLTTYGFNAKKDLFGQLFALNQDVAAKIEKGSPVTAPGVPQNYPDAKKLVTEDCIKPQRKSVCGNR